MTTLDDIERAKTQISHYVKRTMLEKDSMRAAAHRCLPETGVVPKYRFP